jgi:hypothetical protein
LLKAVEDHLFYVDADQLYVDADQQRDLVFDQNQ